MSSTERLAPRRTSPTPPPRRIAADLVGGLSMLAIVALFLANAGQGRLDWLFPKAIAYALGVISIYLVIRGLRGYGDTVAAVPPLLRGQGRDVATFIALAVVYVVLSPVVGFWVMSVAMIAVTSIYLDANRSRRHVVGSVVVGVAITITAYVLLLHVFYVPLPESRWLPF